MEATNLASLNEGNQICCSNIVAPGMQLAQECVGVACRLAWLTRGFQSTSIMDSQATAAELRHLFMLMAPARMKQPSETVRPPHMCSSMLLYCCSETIDSLECTVSAQIAMGSFQAWQRMTHMLLVCIQELSCLLS